MVVIEMTVQHQSVLADAMAEQGKIRMYFYSLPINEGMTTDHPGGLNSYMNDVGKAMPEQLINEAARYGATLDKKHKAFQIKRRTRTVNYPAGEGKPALQIQEYQLYTSAVFDMTQCIEEWREDGFHLPRHTPNCSKYESKIELWDMPW